VAQLKRHSVLPGFGLSLGYTLFYLSAIVLLPLLALVLKTMRLSWHDFVTTVTDPEVMAAYRVSFGASFIAALINAVLGLVVAWVLVRYQFFGKRFLDAIIDLPFALPTAVAGIALATLYAKNGWIGHLVPARTISISHPHLIWSLSWKLPLIHISHQGSVISQFYFQGTQLAYTWSGIVLALTFIGMPFVVRTIQPVLQDLDPELEEAASSLGAGRWMVFRRVIFPELWPPLVTGFSLSFARAVGEYGSVIFIAGNMPMRTEIAPLLIVKKLESYEYSQATAIAVVMLLASFIILLLVSLLQKWTAGKGARR
jgi:sulfate transport system permease protein